MKYWILLLSFFVMPAFAGGSHNSDSTTILNLTVEPIIIEHVPAPQAIPDDEKDSKGVASTLATIHASQFDWGYKGMQAGIGLAEAGDEIGMAVAGGMRIGNSGVLVTMSLSTEGNLDEDLNKGVGASFRF